MTKYLHKNRDDNLPERYSRIEGFPARSGQLISIAVFVELFVSQTYYWTFSSVLTKFMIDLVS